MKITSVTGTDKGRTCTMLLFHTINIRIISYWQLSYNNQFVADCVGDFVDLVLYEKPIYPRIRL